MANSVDPDQNAPIGAVCSGSTLFASILNLSVMFGNYLQQTTSADDIFRCIFLLGALRVSMIRKYHNHTKQTNPQHHEEEPQNINSNNASGRQSKQSNQLSFPCQDDSS